MCYTLHDSLVNYSKVCMKNFIAMYSFDRIEPLLCGPKHITKIEIHGERRQVKTTSTKLRCLKHNKCVECGIEGNVFVARKEKNATTISLNLYNYNPYKEKGTKWTLITHDHIIPRSLGGSKNSQTNIQTMCTCCNNKKGSDITNDDIRTLLLKGNKGKRAIRRMHDLPEHIRG